MGERLVCNQEVIGSIPFTSTNLRPKGEGCPPKRRKARRRTGPSCFGWQAILRNCAGGTR